ncbi:MAG: hypothetical protein JNK34_09390 [Tabrizicola sp.]|nr:hypothetical protein [Tabrizicola sp.]
MEWMFAIAVLMAAGLIAGAYRFSTRAAGHFTAASACLWIIGVTLLWLNSATFPDDETLREMGEGVAVMPLLVALPLTIIAIFKVIAGLNLRKEA